MLYKDFRANKQNDPDQIQALRKSVAVYKQAKDFFNQFLNKAGAERRQDGSEGEHQGLRQGHQAARASSPTPREEPAADHAGPSRRRPRRAPGRLAARSGASAPAPTKK